MRAGADCHSLWSCYDSYCDGEDKSGIIVPPDRPDAIADRIELLDRNRARLLDLRINARDAVRGYSWQSVAMRTRGTLRAASGSWHGKGAALMRIGHYELGIDLVGGMSSYIHRVGCRQRELGAEVLLYDRTPRSDDYPSTVQFVVLVDDLMTKAQRYALDILHLHTRSQPCRQQAFL